MPPISFKSFVQGSTAASTPLGGTEQIVIIQGGAVVQCVADDLGGGGGGGSSASVIVKTANFTANDPSGTIYTNDGAGDAIIATIGNVSAATEYTFIGYPTGSNFYLQPDTGITINFFNFNGNTNIPVSIVGGDGFAFDVTTDYGSVKMVQTDSETWVVISSTSNMEPTEP